MTITSEGPAMPAGMSDDERSAWNAFGDRVAAARQRDAASERPSWGTGDILRILDLYLHGWLVGESGFRAGTLMDWLAHLTYGLSLYTANEQTTAREWTSCEARLFMREEIAKAGGREVSFVLGCPLEGLVAGVHPRYDNPKVLVRGNADRTLLGAQAVMDELGDFHLPLVLHNHPTGDLSPSDADLEMLGRLMAANRSIGFGILSPDADRLYLCYEPRFTRDQYDLARLVRAEGVGGATPHASDAPADGAVSSDNGSLPERVSGVDLGSVLR